MKIKQYIFRSLKYYRWANLWVILGVMLGTAILTGSLIVGDSVRISLTRMVSDRLGKTQFAMVTGDRLFQISLADSLQQQLNVTTAPILQVRGSAIADGGQKRLNQISIMGVDSRFGDLGVTDLYDSLDLNEVIVNTPLASKLDLQIGDALLLRFEKLDAMPKDAPLASTDDQTVARRFVIKAIADAEDFGHYQLDINQVTPNTAFVHLSSLAKELELEGKGNGLLVGNHSDQSLNLPILQKTLAKIWTLKDAGFVWKPIHNNQHLELRSERIFMESMIQDVASEIEPSGQPVLSYFVNRMEANGRLTPYSFVAAPGNSITKSLKDDEIIVNRWMADDLRISVGDSVRLAYFVIESLGTLKEKMSSFRVKKIVPLTGRYADRDLLPDFPGLSDEAHCRDWEAGIPIDYDLIRDKDEDYWTAYGGTPKAFINLNVAKTMWQNRFGSATAIRFNSNNQSDLNTLLKSRLTPEQFGFVFMDVREAGLIASSQSVDFGQLFLGLSFFVIVAALLLTGLLFVFHVESREEETGLLLAVGFTRKSVKRIVMREGVLLAVSGCLLGGIAGLGVNQMILNAMGGIWSGVVGTTSLQMAVKPLTVLIGMGVGFLLAIGTMAVVIRKQIQKPITQQQKGQITGLSRFPVVSLILGCVSLVSVLILFLMSPSSSGHADMGRFFLIGTLIFIGGISLISVMIYFYPRFFQNRRLSLFQVSLMGHARRRLRSLTLMGLLACGLFLVFTVGANRKSAVVNADQRKSGTGGFGLLAETAIPILNDLNTGESREEYGIEDLDLQSVQFIPFRVKLGDDASCLNLNRVTHPQLLGVNPEALIQRNAFTFADMMPHIDPDNPWDILNQSNKSDMIPAIADLTVIIWGLGKQVGDTLTYVDENGQSFQVQLVAGLANSVFQGNLILSETALLKKYPSISGSRFFLIDTSFDSLDVVSQTLSHAFQDQGMDVVKTSDQLAAFNQIENTYLSIFLILGGFGLILGSIGIGIVVMRNIQERRGELALMRAVGYEKTQLQKILFNEHVTLLLIGLVIGLVSAGVATIPSITTPGTHIPFGTIGLFAVFVLFNGMAWTAFAVRMAMKKGVVERLREE